MSIAEKERKTFNVFCYRTFTENVTTVPWYKEIRIPFPAISVQLLQACLFDNPTGAAATGSLYHFNLNSDLVLSPTQNETVIATICQRAGSSTTNSDPPVFSVNPSWTFQQQGIAKFWTTTPTGALMTPSNADSVDDPVLSFILSFRNF